METQIANLNQLIANEIYDQDILIEIRSQFTNLSPSSYPQIHIEEFVSKLYIADELIIDILIIIMNSPSMERLLATDFLNLINWTRVANYPTELFKKLIAILEIASKLKNIKYITSKILLQSPERFLNHDYAIEELLSNFHLAESKQTANFIRCIIFNHQLTEEHKEIFQKYPISFNSILDQEATSILLDTFEKSTIIELLDGKYNNLTVIGSFLEYLTNEQPKQDLFLSVFKILNIEKSWVNYIEDAVKLFKNYLLFSCSISEFNFISDLLQLIVDVVTYETLCIILNDFLYDFMKENVNMEPLIDAIDTIIISLNDDERDSFLQQVTLEDFSKHELRRKIVTYFTA